MAQHQLPRKLVAATPLIFTGLATAVAFRARIWNIGAEARFSPVQCAPLGPSTAWRAHRPSSSFRSSSAPVGGAFYAALAAILKTRDEVISTVMLNYIIVYALSLLRPAGPWSKPGAFFEQSANSTRTACCRCFRPARGSHQLPPGAGGHGATRHGAHAGGI